jgi:hypothetical protein
VARDLTGYDDWDTTTMTTTMAADEDNNEVDGGR